MTDTGAFSHNIATVLIVDDDPVLCAIAEMFFQKRGVKKVFTAVNGHHGLQLVDQFAGEIDFVLCDLNMPELDGVQFLRHLKDRNFRGHIAILSGETAAVVKVAENLAKSHNLNILGALAKPLRMGDLERIVNGINSPAQQAATSIPVLATVHDLRHALATGELVPYYQPKIDVRTHAVSGAEALARWQHPKLGMIGPNFFIPMAEQNGLLGELTNKMITSSIENMKTWRMRNVNPKVSINLGADTLQCIEFPDEMSAKMRAADLECSSIVFEITERQLVEKSTTSSEVLARLRIMGFGISIDDFGTGYSNIEQLREFPFSELKIDQSFIREAHHDQFARASVEASTKLGKQLSLRLVAEGVETKEDWSFVAASGIDEVQGYLIAKPMPAEDFVNWVTDYEARVGSSRIRRVHTAS